MTKISQLTDLGDNLAASDEFVIRDVSDASTPNKKVTASGFANAVANLGLLTLIAAGSGPQSRVQCTSSGTSEIVFTTSATERLSINNAGQVASSSLGSAAVPIFTFSGDTDTGIYSPGADQVAISTNGARRLLISNGQIQADTLFSVAMGGVGFQTIFRNGANEDNYIAHGASGFTAFRNHNGSEFMRLDSSGRLGLGTSSAARAAILTTKAANQSIASGNALLSVITSDSQAANVGGSIALGGQSTDADWVYASLSGRSENNSYAGYLAFATSASGGQHNERMRITSAGLVGVGTSLPRGQVSIANNSTGSLVDSSLHFGYSLSDYYGFRIVNSSDPVCDRHD